MHRQVPGKPEHSMCYMGCKQMDSKARGKKAWKGALCWKGLLACRLEDLRTGHFMICKDKFLFINSLFQNPILAFPCQTLTNVNNCSYLPKSHHVNLLSRMPCKHSLLHYRSTEKWYEEIAILHSGCWGFTKLLLTLIKRSRWAFPAVRKDVSFQLIKNFWLKENQELFSFLLNS